MTAAVVRARNSPPSRNLDREEDEVADDEDGDDACPAVAVAVPDPDSDPV